MLTSAKNNEIIIRKLLIEGNVPPSPPSPLLKTNAQLERNLERNRVNEINTNIFFKGYNSKSAMCKLGNEYVIMTKRNILHTIRFAFRSNHIRDRC